MEIYSLRHIVLQYAVWMLTTGLPALAKDPLRCLQCKNYDKFFTDPVQSRVDCSDASNYVETTCDVSSTFCLKAMGKVSGNGRPSSVVPTEGSAGVIYSTGNNGAPTDVMLRGCVGPEALLVFSPDGNSYRSEGGCQSGRREVPVPYEASYASNSTPAYMFDGSYCLCRNDRCNGAASFTSNGYGWTIFTTALIGLLTTLRC